MGFFSAIVLIADLGGGRRGRICVCVAILTLVRKTEWLTFTRLAFALSYSGQFCCHELLSFVISVYEMGQNVSLKWAFYKG